MLENTFYFFTHSTLQGLLLLVYTCGPAMRRASCCFPAGTGTRKFLLVGCLDLGPSVKITIKAFIPSFQCYEILK